MGLTQHHTGTDIVARLLNLMLVCGMIGRWGAAMIPIRGQNNVQGCERRRRDPVLLHRLSLGAGSEGAEDLCGRMGRARGAALAREGPPMVTEIVAEGSPMRGLYIMGENPVLSDPDIAHAEHWLRNLDFLAVQDLFLTETAR